MNKNKERGLISWVRENLLLPLRSRDGFTLIEVIVAMAIIMILVLLASSVYRGYSMKARISQVRYDARVIENSLEEYGTRSEMSQDVLTRPVTAEFLDAIAKKGTLIGKEGVIESVGEGEYYEMPESFIKQDLDVRRRYKDKVYLIGEGVVYIDISNSIYEGTEEPVPEPEIPEPDDPEIRNVCDLIPADGRYFDIDEFGYITAFYQDGQGELPLLYDVNIPSAIDETTVRGIRAEVFRGKGLTGVCIPNTVEDIGQFAFKDNEIQSVILPQSLTRLAEGAFAGNSVLSEVYLNSNITDTVSSIWGYEGMFQGANLKENIHIADHVTYIPKKIFFSSGVTSIDLNNVVKVDKAAFEHNSIEYVDLKNVLYVEELAFSSNLISDINWSQVRRIDEEAFARNLFTSLKVAESVEYLGVGAFLYNTTLEAVEITHNFEAYPNIFIGDRGIFGFSNLEDRIIIGPNVTRLPEKVFYKANVTSIDLNNVEIIAGGAIENNTNLNTVDLKKTRVVGELAFSNSGVTSVNLRNVEIIGDEAFQYNFLASVNLPSTLIEIGSEAFQLNRKDGVKTLTHVTLNSDIMRSGAYIFRGSDIQNNLTIHGAVTRIPDRFFEEAGITQVTIHEGITYIGSAAFRMNNLTSLILPESMDTLKRESFAANPITTLDLGGTSIIEAKSFYANRIISVTLPDSITGIGNLAFADNLVGGEATIRSLKVNGFIQNIGNNVFSRASLENRVVLDDKMTEVPARLFMNAGISDLSFIHENIIKIGDGAFATNKLGEVVMPENVHTYGKSSFENAGITKLTFQGYLSTVGDYAFRGNTGLISITFASNYPFTRGRNMFPYEVVYMDAGTYTLSDGAYRK